MKLRESVLYFHINLIKQEIFYIGIGNKHRPYSQGSRNNFWKNEVKKYGYHVVVIHESLTWKEACELEKQYIKQIGRRDLSLGTLVNLTDGGEGLEPGTDKTKEIAAKYTDKIYDYKWDDNFAEARNESIKYATKDWVLILDADEEVISTKEELQQILNIEMNLYDLK